MRPMRLLCTGAAAAWPAFQAAPRPAQDHTGLPACHHMTRPFNQGAAASKWSRAHAAAERAGTARRRREWCGSGGEEAIADAGAGLAVVQGREPGGEALVGI